MTSHDVAIGVGYVLMAVHVCPHCCLVALQDTRHGHRVALDLTDLDAPTALTVFAALLLWAVAEG